MVKVVPEFFKEDSKNGKKILIRADHLYAEREEAYLGDKCSQYDLPYFDVNHSEFDWIEKIWSQWLF